MFTSPTLPMLLLWNVRRAEMSYTSLLANKDDISELEFVFCIFWRTEDVREANNTNGGGDIHWVQGLKKYYSLLIILSRRKKKNTEIWGKKVMRLKANNKTIFIFISFQSLLKFSNVIAFLPTSLPDKSSQYRGCCWGHYANEKLARIFDFHSFCIMTLCVLIK